MLGLNKLDTQNFFLYQELDSKNKDVCGECYEQIIHYQNRLIKKINEKIELIHARLSEQNFEMSILEEGINLTHRDTEKNTVKIVKLSEDVMKIKGRICKLTLRKLIVTQKRYGSILLKSEKNTIKFGIQIYKKS